MISTASAVIQTLTDINNNYSNLLLVLIAGITAFVAYREYSLRKRPYVVPEISVEITDENWSFYLILVNKGERPVVARISEALLSIGDENYPTIFNNEIILAQGEKQKIAPIGHINKKGRSKIIGHEYKKNRFEINICLESKSLGEKKFKYRTKAEYSVSVEGERPVITLDKEEML